MKAYQLKITIKDSHPPIWRRVIVPAGLSFSQLSVVINEVMDWSGYHLFSFEFFKQNLRIEETEEDFGFGHMNTEEASETLIDTYLDQEERFTYVYDFGDDWRHTVVVEKIIEEYDKDYPVVLKYKGETPIEDCGGIWGFYDKQQILENPDDPEYEEILEWSGESLTDSFDLENMNGRLEALFLSKKKSKPMRQRDIYKELLDSGTGFKQIQGMKGFNKNKSFDEQDVFDKRDEIQRLLETHVKDLKKQLENLKKQQRNALEDITLRDIYQDYTKDNLIEIAKNHHLGGYSKFRKNELIKFLIYNVLDKDVMCRYLTFLDDDELEILEKFSDPANYGAATEKDMGSSMALFAGGYAGSSIIDDIIVPEEVLQAYKKNCDKEWKRRRREERELSYYLNAAAELYGICPMEKALDIYKKHTGKEIDEIKMYSFCLTIPENKKVFTYNGVTICHKIYWEEDKVEELMAAQKGQPYYMPTKKEALTLGKDGYLPFDDSMKELESFLNVFFGEIPGYAKDLCCYIQGVIRAGAEIEDIMEFMEDNDIFEEVYDRTAVENFKQLLLKVWHRTRKMSNRGNLPKGMTRQEIIGAKTAEEKQGKADVLKFPIDINKKVYPNDPCPCGSGKKYKKCCGRNK